MSSENPVTRNHAHKKIRQLLHLFPNHDLWPDLAARSADYLYDQGKYKSARDFYFDLSQKTNNSPRWYKEAALSKAAIGEEYFGKPQQNQKIDLPPLSYETYMTNNWMALIRLMRFYEQKEHSEAETLIKLKDISKSDEEIKLSPMPTLAELDDNSANLGYSLIILPSQLSMLKRCISAGFPVIQPLKNSFYLLSGIDAGRSIVTGYNHEHILEGLKKADIEDVSAAMLTNAQDNTDEGSSHSRIDILTRTQIPFSFWQSTQQKDYASHMALVFPAELKDQILEILGDGTHNLRKQHDAHISSLIALSLLKSGDIIQSVKWAMKSYDIDANNLSLDIGYLARLFWQSRDKNIQSRLHLEHYLPRLKEIDDFLATEKIRNFLIMAERRFTEDFSESHLQWIIRDQYKDFLDRSNAGDRQRLMALARYNIETQPDAKVEWLILASLYEWEKNTDKMIEAYRGALAAGPWDDTIAIKLAYLLTRSNAIDEAEKVVRQIDRRTSKYDPDFIYSLASIARNNKDYSQALKLYEKAIYIRKYNPNYHIDLANLIEQQGGDRSKIAALRKWASRLKGIPTATAEK